MNWFAAPLAAPGLDIAVRTMLALVFLTAAVGKLRHWRTFEGVVANYRLLPAVLVAPMTYLLPPLEIVVGFGLLVQRASPWTSLAAALLLATFAVAMAVNLVRGRSHIDCGCFQSTLQQTLRWPLVARNGVLVLLLGATVGSAPARIDVWSVVTGLLAGAAGFVVLQSLNTLWAIVPAFSNRTSHAQSTRSP